MAICPHGGPRLVELPLNEGLLKQLFTQIHGPLDIDDPLPTAGGAATSKPEPSPEQIDMLVDMGFTLAQARKALRETVS